MKPITQTRRRLLVTALAVLASGGSIAGTHLTPGAQAKDANKTQTDGSDDPGGFSETMTITSTPLPPAPPPSPAPSPAASPAPAPSPAPGMRTPAGSGSGSSGNSGSNPAFTVTPPISWKTQCELRDAAICLYIKGKLGEVPATVCVAAAKAACEFDYPDGNPRPGWPYIQFTPSWPPIHFRRG